MYLVTGGAGFIGSNVAAMLVERGRDVVICDWLGDDGVKWRNLAHHLIDTVIHPEELFDFLARRGGEIEAVIHMGAISATTAKDADLVLKSNFRLSQDLWNWCAANEAPFIYASSAATYGDGEQGFVDSNAAEDVAALRPLNLYGWSKHWFDRWALQAVETGKPRPPQWAGLKFFNVYGPNEYHKDDMMSVVAKNYGPCAAGEAVRLFRSHRPDYEDGGQLRDFVYVRDCVDVIAFLLDNPQAQGLFNVGSGEARSFKDLVTAIYSACDTEPSITYFDMPESLRDKYQYFTQADLGRLRAAGYNRPMTRLEDGVADYVRRFLSQPDPHN